MCTNLDFGPRVGIARVFTVLASGLKVGGVQTVTLGDEEARARGTQKSVLERKAPSTFPLLIEMRERSHWVAHQVLLSSSFVCLYVYHFCICICLKF